MQSKKAIKANARLALKNNWAECIFASIINIAVFFCVILSVEIINDVFKSVMYTDSGMSVLGLLTATVTSAIAFFMIVPVIFGSVRWFWYCSFGEKLPLTEIFYYFSDRTLLIKSVLLGIRLFADFVFTCAICLLPAAVLVGVYDKNVSVLIGYGEKIGDALFYLVLAVFLAISIPLVFKLTLRCVLAPIIFILDEKTDPFYAVKLSKKVLSGRRNETFFVFVSFAGWIVLSFLGITLVYTLPFLSMSYVIFARYSVINHRLEYTNNGVKPLV